MSRGLALAVLGATLLVLLVKMLLHIRSEQRRGTPTDPAADLVHSFAERTRTTSALPLLRRFEVDSRPRSGQPQLLAIGVALAVTGGILPDYLSWLEASGRIREAGGLLRELDALSAAGA